MTIVAMVLVTTVVMSNADLRIKLIRLVPNRHNQREELLLGFFRSREAIEQDTARGQVNAGRKVFEFLIDDCFGCLYQNAGLVLSLFAALIEERIQPCAALKLEQSGIAGRQIPQIL